MTAPFRLYGTPGSLYTGKARCYLIKKQVPYREVLASDPKFLSEVIANDIIILDARRDQSVVPAEPVAASAAPAATVPAAAAPARPARAAKVAALPRGTNTFDEEDLPF